MKKSQKKKDFSEDSAGLQNITNVHTAHGQIYQNQATDATLGVRMGKEGLELPMTLCQHLVLLNFILIPTQSKGSH